MKRYPTAAAFATSLILSACVVTADETTLAPEFATFDWQLAEVDGASPGWSATLNLDAPGKISGQAPCNRFDGPLTYEGGAFKVGNLTATKMACQHIQGEAEFFALLQGIETAERLPGLLVLTGGGHEMRFVQPVN